MNDNEKAPAVAPVHYAYLDHTADVQLHSWGDSLEEAIQQLVISLYGAFFFFISKNYGDEIIEYSYFFNRVLLTGYMTMEISSVQPAYSMDFTASGHDLFSLLYNLLDTCLYNFSTEPFFIGSSARVLNFDQNKVANGAEKFSVHLN